MSSKILLLDNYDSFTYNLVEVIRQEVPSVEVTVIRNDKIELSEVERFDKILLSPGPSVPENAGKMLELIEKYAPEKPILGVCLGHQAIGEVFGSKLINMKTVLHGIQTEIELQEHYLFNEIPRRVKVGRYHSWLIDENTLNGNLQVIAKDDNGQIMAVAHQKYDVCGVQFHPESVMTPEGAKMMKNWIER
ncbi:aminodeoxychorismate/anthranilate synthase component II [Marivirga lumbricoides]|uniref:Aminodeoxychorismate/anthranilate synthase component II n=1 Tax=Marivirga lumbricoides TaxID=1046115 RepID=A0A2T4DVG5_9BACT|nr:aminodeoxychorismate/anthranilate synthase component II [Marivirga lumbricoides]